MPHVLLIEDDARIREIVERGLGSRGFVVTSAEDGPTGLELAQKLEVDVVLLDLMLPGLSGLEVLEGIRLAKPRLPVVALTALDDTRSKVAGLDAGADDYIVKPFDTPELLARIRGVLRRSKDHRAASPLTGLPGNVRIEDEIDTRLDQGKDFAVLYADLDHFKAFNDHYGFLRGDQAIQAEAVAEFGPDPAACRLQMMRAFAVVAVPHPGGVAENIGLQA